MFDGDVRERERDGESAGGGAWKELHAEIVSVFRQRTTLIAREVALLRRADETRLYARLGYTSIYGYIEGELGLSHHSATERMRVAWELRTLPATEQAFMSGAVPWTTVRELTRVATPQTEEVWLSAVDQVRAPAAQAMLRGRGKGALPGDPVDSSQIRHRIVLEDVSAEVFALFRQARIAAAEAGATTDDALVRAMAQAVLEPGGGEAAADARPPFQRSVTTCRECKQSQLVSAGSELPIDEAMDARVECDHEDIGDLEREEGGRRRSAIPLPIRRKVLVRDRFQCVVPGCRACRFLEVHHVVPRAKGGRHVLSNLITLCDGHHKLLHDGFIAISGEAPDRLEIERASVPAGTDGGAGTRDGPGRS